MSDPLTRRIARLISGAAHQMVDAAEGLAPDAVMEQAIRELNTAIEEVVARQGEIRVREHLATKRLAQETACHEDLDEKTRIALDRGQKDLATAGVEKMIDIEAQIPVLQHAIAAAAEEREEVTGYLDALRGRRNEMLEELRAYREEQRREAGVENAPGTIAGSRSKSAERASAAFDDAMGRATGLAPSGSASTGEQARKLNELDDFARKNRVEERLRKMESGD